MNGVVTGTGAALGRITKWAAIAGGAFVGYKLGKEFPKGRLVMTAGGGLVGFAAIKLLGSDFGGSTDDDSALTEYGETHAILGAPVRLGQWIGDALANRPRTEQVTGGAFEGYDVVPDQQSVNVNALGVISVSDYRMPNVNTKDMVILRGNRDAARDYELATGRPSGDLPPLWHQMRIAAAWNRATNELVFIPWANARTYHDVRVGPGEAWFYRRGDLSRIPGRVRPAGAIPT